MEHLERPITRRGMLKAGAVSAAGLYAAGTLGRAGRAAGATRVSAGGATLNWLTWSDHFLTKPNQLGAVKKLTGITGRPQLFSDDSDSYVKVKAGGGGWDMSSEDALWVPKFYNEGLIVPFDIKSFPVSKQLYPVALDVPFWKAGSNQMGYPFGWSSLQIYYNPKYVTTKPDSYHALLNKSYKKKIVLENQPTDLMAMAGLATGSKQPYNMSTAEIAKAQQFLKAAKPAFLKLVSQNSETVRALADGSAAMVICNLGTQFRVKEAGGPTVKMATPSEGVVGFIDGEQIVKASKHRNRFPQFMNSIAQAKWIAQNFIANGRPLFNEQAYKLLVNQGYKDRADGLFYNTPERALEMHLKGPSGNEQAYIDAFNQVFGV